ncbi:MAG: hypothetical protein HUJ26_14420 [Planctomycetaceae bacterium]|nr:hypothetical protein [Planctomycetaceae bacterium]
MRHQLMMIGVGLCISVTMSADTFHDSVYGADTAPSEVQNPHPRVIVTTMGRLVEGKITYSAGGYVVDVRGGSFLVPFQLVKFTADSRHDAYVQYRKLIPEETAQNHLRLAKWCLNYSLVNDAVHELKQTLFLDESRKDAAQLLAAIERRRRLGTLGEESEMTTPREPAVKVAVSLQGLSPETVKEYSSAIQPVLMNNCAKAGCHHSQADNDFRLNYVRVTGFGNRIASSENLAAVIDQLNVENPGQSPFLVKARANHGEARNTLVFSPHGKEILARLEKWSVKASRELSPQQSFANSSSGHSMRETRKRVDDPSNKTITRESLPKDKEVFIEEILSQQRRDPFSPQQFNRNVRPSGN